MLSSADGSLEQLHTHFHFTMPSDPTALTSLLESNSEGSEKKSESEGSENEIISLADGKVLKQVY